eukprot:CAMPEP_0194762634 /NCGR_PEP_ID=MMETSP0323_2-20130528/16382_1 /TAXON_ID=2866 ORGANISM="Crypthecodinium cohnii, Strain Seligo" /NCGR_SAMPLE_ID=MMETSP0323_2 /ASSEMBLY_ACC=CAM_ASM_000346 /LENGTH=115 /DNA_ID=CAMNT_0039685431 /DNA_START=39 /DNA_END=383 /DNA_ORIENTATION=-
MRGVGGKGTDQDRLGWKGMRQQQASREKRGTKIPQNLPRLQLLDSWKSPVEEGPKSETGLAIFPPRNARPGGSQHGARSLPMLFEFVLQGDFGHLPCLNLTCWDDMLTEIGMPKL